MVIRVRDISGRADTAKQGEAFYIQLLKAFRERDPLIVVSFDGIDTATSSFVNVSFVQLLHCFSFNEIRRRLKVVDSTRQINDMIRRRLSYEAELTA